MTNSLHRRGSVEDLKGDFIIFAKTDRLNVKGSKPRLQKFFQMSLKYNPVNVGVNHDYGSENPSIDQKYSAIEDGSIVAVVFDNTDDLIKYLEEVKEEDFGISINISGLVEEIHECCKKVGITRHSIEQSLGVHGATDRLPNRDILEITTMCGHGMISFNLIKKIIDYVKLGKMTPEEGAKVLAKPCLCGVFNPARATQLLERIRVLG
ncbi:MAG: hypothetical protein APF84_00225 [Gracilibacter sp. BRH_c7a]|nr:MAG: hypothetical protein APF84_00225 [Gracilibacter sp. BRH_c7a]